MEKLTCDLFAPGMTPLHRAGLGGLVATIRRLEKETPPVERPPGRWTIDERSATFTWENNNEAKALFTSLFTFAFQLRDGLIYLPGQYGELPPPPEVLAALHDGLLLSFYDHGVQSRGKKAEAQIRTYEVDEKPLSYRYLPLAWYKHQRDGYKAFAASLQGNLELSRSLFPGAIQRHAGLTGTHVTHPARLALPLLFAPVGVFALKAGGKRINDRGKRKFKSGAALLIPDFHTLSGVEFLLPTLLPKQARDCQVASATDATLQAELRLRSRNLLDPLMIPSIRCVWCCPADWNSRLQPPSLVTEVMVQTVDPRLDQFATAMAALPPPVPRQSKKGEYFWPKSTLRPFIADNLAAGRVWYAGFTRLMNAQDPATNTPLRNAVHFERKGLSLMTQEIRWDHPGEETVVRAVHEALRCRYGRIAAENTNNPVTMKKRMTREYERLRLGFAGAKTADTFRHALTDLWSRAGSNSVLKDAWPQVLPLLTNQKWQVTRDLTLLALASYRGKSSEEDIDLAIANEETQESQEMEE